MSCLYRDIFSQILDCVWTRLNSVVVHLRLDCACLMSTPISYTNQWIDSYLRFLANHLVTIETLFFLFISAHFVVWNTLFLFSAYSYLLPFALTFMKHYTLTLQVTLLIIWTTYHKQTISLLSTPSSLLVSLTPRDSRRIFAMKLV